MDQIRKELEDLNQRQKEWREDIAAPLIPPTLVAMGQMARDACCQELAELIMTGREDEAAREHANYFTTALAFGLYLGMRGYSYESFVPYPDMTLSDEDIRRLLSGDAS